MTDFYKEFYRQINSLTATRYGGKRKMTNKHFHYLAGYFILILSNFS